MTNQPCPWCIPGIDNCHCTQEEIEAHYKSKEPLPPPGSKEAKELGCKCPVIDNNHGRGYMGIPGVFVYNESCQLHFPTK